MTDAKQQYASLKQLPGQTGYQVMRADGTVILSAGDLQNKDAFAATVAKMVAVADYQSLAESYRNMHVYYDTHYYSICRAGDKIFVAKCKLDSHSSEPVAT